MTQLNPFASNYLGFVPCDEVPEVPWPAGSVAAPEAGKLRNSAGGELVSTNICPSSFPSGSRIVAGPASLGFIMISLMTCLAPFVREATSAALNLCSGVSTNPVS